ncbi:hypothetical protein N7457_003908 [Penicillium paradoxum]|uniref:uncharacterized protein n=1 Tax=Penicillium paradoxum TaxID=176176 RepID=UPI0025490974|nr:uncharacterized protein N7457_003908 [Penicillium paradoxum]KAJ5782134.1 hypothetical protein N7457_003908 [Penicillium paradoxum]
MDHPYDNLVGLDQAQHNSALPMARSMRVVKQDRSLVERDEKPRKQRKRALVACNRCRKRKIKCNGDLNTGLACSSCRSVGATECQYNRVNSLAPEDAAREAARRFATKPQTRSALLSMAPYQRDEYDLDVQSSFSRQPVGMDSLHYDDHSAGYHGQTSPGYMLSSTAGAMLDYGSAWGNRAWDPVINGRSTNGEFFEEPSPSMNQAAYGFVLPGQAMSSAEMPQSTGAIAMASYTDAVDRTLPTPPTCRSQPQPNVTGLSSLPDGLSGMSLAGDVKGPFWNSRYAPSIPSNGNALYNVSSSTRIKSNESDDGAPELVFGFIPEDASPLSTAPSSMPPSSAANPPYPALDTIDSLVGEYNAQPDVRLGRTFSRDAAGQRLLTIASDCTPDVYGYSSDRRKSRGDGTDTRCSAPTLVNGLPYTRVRHADSGVAFPYNLLPDNLSEYSRVDNVHRAPISPLGGHQAY